MVDYAKYVDHLRHIHLDELTGRPALVYIVTFVFNYHEIARRDYTNNFSKLCCLCLRRVNSELPSVLILPVELGIPEVALCELIRPIICFCLSTSSKSNFLMSWYSLSASMETLEGFSDKAFL